MKNPLFNLLLMVTAAGGADGCRDVSTGIAPHTASSVPGMVRVDEVARVRLEDLYEIRPDIAGCEEGRLKGSEKLKALQYVNAVRALHDLPPVSYRSDDDRAVAQSALIMAANNLVSHDPPPSLTCWTPEGYAASSRSNLAILSFRGTGDELATTEQIIDMFWKDTLVTELGHRRWLLNPFLKYISFGRVDRPALGDSWGVSGAAMRIVYDQHQDLSGSKLDYVAYPFRDYPAELYNGDLSMSFSVLADRKIYRNNERVDYAGARVEIIDDGGARVAVRSVRHDNLAYGLANCLYWQADVRPGIRYAVRVSGVRVAGDVRSYEYWFTLRSSV
jgi:hypothetical protein